MKKFHIFASITVAFCLVLLCSLVASAAQFSDGISTIEVTNATVGDTGTVSTQIEGGTNYIMGFIPAPFNQTQTVKIVNKSEHDITLNGDLVFTSVGGEANFTISGTTTSVTVGNPVTISNPGYVLAANGGELTIQMVSPNGAGNTLALNWTVQIQAKITHSVTFAPAEHGSYTVGGTPITANTPVNIDGTEGTTISVTPDQGYICLGFTDATGKMVIGMPAAATAGATQTVNYYPTGSGQTLTPVFASGFSNLETEKLPFRTGGKYYYTWESAMAAGYGSTVILNKDYELPTTLAANGLTSNGTYVTGTDGNLTYTVPGATTLLIPFDEAGTAGDTYSNGFTMSKFRELTMPSGTHMTINGTLLIQSAQGHFNTQSMGNPVGPYGCLTMKSGSTITVNGVLKVRGMLIGDEGMQRIDPGEGTVPITVNSGAKVNQLVQVCDFRGGSKSLLWYTKDAFLVNQLYTMNIQVGTRYIAGSTLEGQYFFYIDDNPIPGVLNMISSAANSLFSLTEGHLDMGYDRENVASIIDITGTVDMNYVELSFTYMGAPITLKTSNNQLPLFAGWKVNIKNGTTANINYDMKLLPGCEVTVEQGAMMNVNANMYLYDVADYVQRGECYSFTGYRHYPNTYYTTGYPTGNTGLAPEETTDGALIVNGILNINKNVTRADGTVTSGALYTSTKAGQDGTFPLYSTENTGVINVNKAASASVNLTELIQATSETETTVAFTAAKSLMAPNCTVNPLAGTTGTYYHMVGHGWHTAQHTVTESVTEAATCTETGTKQISCTCGYLNEETIPVLEHSYTGAIKSDGNGKDATHSFLCVNGCNKYGGAVKHSWNSGAVTTKPGCITTGVKTYTCTADGCGATYTETVAAAGHTFSETVAAKEATCLAAGNNAYKQCTVCNLYFAANAATTAADGKANTTSFVIPQKSHSYTGAIKSDGNGKDATHSYKCVNGCNQYGNTVEHSWNSGVVTTEPGCTTTGIKTYTCTDGCGATYTETVAAKGHSYNSEVTEPTCTEEGYTTYTCSACGDSYKDAQVEAKGHSYGDWIIDAEATCTAKGSKHKECATCGDTVTEDIDALGHDMKATEAKAATCTAEGNNEYWTCGNCKKVFADAEGTTETTVTAQTIKIDPNAHAWGEATYNWDAENKTHSAQRVCGNDESHIETATANTTSKETKAANCTEAGTIVYTTTFTEDWADAREETVSVAAYHVDMQVKGEVGFLECDACNAPLVRLAAIEASADAATELRLKFYIHDDLLQDKDGNALPFSAKTVFRGITNTFSLSAIQYDAKRDYYVLTRPVASGEMVDEMTVSFFGDGDTPLPIIEADGKSVSEVSRSVMDYAALVMAKSTNDAQRELVRSLVVYGGYAQTFFKEKDNSIITDPLAYDILNEGTPSLGETTWESRDTIGDFGKVDFQSWNVYLDSAIYMRLKFTADSLEGYTFTLNYPFKSGQTVVRKEVALTPTVDSSVTNGYWLDVAYIPAAFFDAPYSITISDGSSSQTITFRVTDYLAGYLENPGTTSYNLAKAMYLYGKAAESFFFPSGLEPTEAPA